MASNVASVADISARGGPVQQGVHGLYTCTQSICGSSYSCSPTGLQLQCVNAMMQGYDMQYNGQTMQCDGDSGRYPYFICTCTIDYLNCDKSSTPSKPSMPSASSKSSTSSAPSTPPTATTTGAAYPLQPRGLASFVIFALLTITVMGGYEL